MIPEKVKALLSHSAYRGLPLTVRHVVQLHCTFSRGMVIFRKWNLSRDVAYGIIGDRGTGKSVSGGFISQRDYLMVGEPVWSNLKIKATLPINDQLEVLLREYEEFTGQEIPRTPVVYESEELDPAKLLSPDPPYKGGMIFVDEMNVELADSLRSTMNQALATSDFMQLMRKLDSGLIATCISEMFLPPRVREAIDVFIRTHDYAFINKSDRYGQRQGVDCEWAIFPVTGKMAGYDNRFSQTKEPWQTIRFHTKNLWGIVNTWDRKQRTKHVTHSLYEADQEQEEVAEAQRPFSDLEVEMLQSKTVEADRADWGWMYQHPFIRKMLETGAEVTASELLDRLAPDAPPQFTKDDVLTHFEAVLNPSKRRGYRGYYYHFGAFERKDLTHTLDEKVLVPA